METNSFGIYTVTWNGNFIGNIYFYLYAQNIIVNNVSKHMFFNFFNFNHYFFYFIYQGVESFLAKVLMLMM